MAVGLERKRVIIITRRLRITGKDKLLTKIETSKCFRLQVTGCRSTSEGFSLFKDFAGEGLRKLIKLHHRRGVFCRGLARWRKAWLQGGVDYRLFPWMSIAELSGLSLHVLNILSHGCRNSKGEAGYESPYGGNARSACANYPTTSSSLG